MKSAARQGAGAPIDRRRTDCYAERRGNLLITGMIAALFLSAGIRASDAAGGKRVVQKTKLVVLLPNIPSAVDDRLTITAVELAEKRLMDGNSMMRFTLKLKTEE